MFHEKIEILNYFLLGVFISAVYHTFHCRVTYKLTQNTAPHSPVQWGVD